MNDIEYIVMYRKTDGEIFLRPYKWCSVIKNIGEDTSMGWTVINILCKYNDNFYTIASYDTIKRELRKEKRNHQKKWNIILCKFRIEIIALIEQKLKRMKSREQDKLYGYNGATMVKNNNYIYYHQM